MDKKEMVAEYRDRIKAIVDNCTDIVLLDLIYKILLKH